MGKNQMEVRACTKCSSLFQTLVKADVCPACQETLNRLFREVKLFIRDNKGAGMAEVAEACHVSVKQILHWVREERLYFSEESQVAIPCLNCGTLIGSGKYCEPCKTKMNRTLSSAYMKPREEDYRSVQVVSIRTSQRLRFEGRL